MGLVTVAVRLLSTDNKVGMDWTFIDINETSLTFSELTESIFTGQIGHCKLKDGIFRCKNYVARYGSCSTSHKLNEEIKGDMKTNIVEKHNKFSMLYFSIFVSHDENCLECKKEEVVPPVRANAFQFLMNAARNQDSDVPVTSVPENKRDELRNAILLLLNENSCKFPKGVGSVNHTFVTKFVNLMWYIDGHTSGIERESNRKLPHEFTEKLSGFNRPELTKHRKRELSNLSQIKLSKLAEDLKEIMQCMKFIDDNQAWINMRIKLLKLANVIEDYASYLRSKNVTVKKIQLTPRSDIEVKTNVSILPVCKKENLYYQLVKLDLKLELAEFYDPLSVREYLPPGLDRKKIYYITDSFLLKKGLTSKATHYVYHAGGPKPSMHFIWKTPTHQSESEAIQNNLNVIRKIEKDIPIFERRVTKREFQNAYGFVSSPHVLRSIFQNLTGDHSASNNMSEREIDHRFEFALLCEDPNIIVDLRNQSKSRDTKFKLFFSETEKYLKSVVGVAVHERRHNQELYLAKAVSFRDLHDRISEIVPDGTPKPSIKWLRYQFQPINPRANAAKYYKSRINIRMMVQKRQVFFIHLLQF